MSSTSDTAKVRTDDAKRRPYVQPTLRKGPSLSQGCCGTGSVDHHRLGSAGRGLGKAGRIAAGL